MAISPPDPETVLQRLTPWALAIRNTLGYSLGFLMIAAMVFRWFQTGQAPPASLVPVAAFLVGANIMAPILSAIGGKRAP